ncbi:MAG: hypothetical protein FJ035_08315 [Chloroflexi bacterium]|nr:hypothetical protein [Chloroflexota bacterium]
MCERLLRLGPQALGTGELLAILLRVGSAREGVLELAGRLLREHRGLRSLVMVDSTGQRNSAWSLSAGVS